MTRKAVMKNQKVPVPVLRWSGSKAKLIPILEKCSPPTFKTYIEPFAGSACLYFRIQPNAAIIGDINPAVIEVYQAIRDNPHEVGHYLASIPETYEAYYSLRGTNPNVLSIEQRAARTIYLMKACFNGVYRTNKSGAFNVPMGSRVYARPSAENLLAASELLTHTQLICGDFEHVVKLAKSGDFVYLDPPYPSISRYRGEYGYNAHFDTGDKQRLIRLLRKLDSEGAQVMLSYVYDEELVSALSGWTCKQQSVLRSVAGNIRFRINASEIVLTNYRVT